MSSSSGHRVIARLSGPVVLGAGLLLATGLATRRAKAHTGAGSERRTPSVPSVPVAEETPVVASVPVARETPVVPSVAVLPETPAVPSVAVLPETPAVSSVAVLAETPAISAPPSVAEVESVAAMSVPPQRDIPEARVAEAQPQRRSLRWVARLGRGALGAVMLAGFVAFLFAGVGPLSGRYRVITVLSGSMRPSMPPGSLVVSTPEPLSALGIGQVVTFQAPTEQHQVVTHRVIQIIRSGSELKIRTKGDANAAPDPWLAQVQGNTVWRERAAIPNGGRLVYWLRRPLVRRITVDIIPVVVVVLVLWTIWGTGRSSASAEPQNA